MHSVDWRVEFRLLLGLLLLALLPGWLFDCLPWALLAATLLYVARSFYQLLRIQRWLAADDGDDPPEAGGLWGDVLDGIYRLQRQGREERKRLQDAVAYLRDSFASLEDGAVMIDQRGDIEWSNHAAERLLGLRYPDDVGQQLVNLLRMPEFIQYFEAADYDQPLEILMPKIQELSRGGAGGFQQELHLQFQVTFFGRGSRLLFARDITRTQRLMQMRQDFVGNVSHELRTPLTVITGYLETLKDSEMLKDKRLLRAIEQMLGQSRRMESLVQDLIALSRLEAVSDNAEQDVVEVMPMLQMIREEVLAVAVGPRQISLEGDAGLVLYGRREELRSAFTNLIVNAARYTASGGQIDISWRGDDNEACFSVSDNGVGIDAQHIPRLTERFYRVDQSRAAHTGGTGLGLAIVKHVLLHHQAQLQVVSSPGEGSTFRCVFPQARCQRLQPDVL